jgi:hypothetical protein
VIIDGKASCHFKQLEDIFGSSNGSRSTAKKNERVISVLENGARVVWENRMVNISSKRVVMEQTAKHISNNNEKVGG